MIDHIIEAQQILEELFSAGVLTFKLFACRMENMGGDEYIVRFHDSRLRSIDLSWQEGESFKDVFRSAVLERMGRKHGDLTKEEN
jgi:hypothetical protein